MVRRIPPRRDQGFPDNKLSSRQWDDGLLAGTRRDAPGAGQECEACPWRAHACDSAAGNGRGLRGAIVAVKTEGRHS